MCYAVFIATAIPQPTGAFVPDVTKLYLEVPGADELRALKNKFTLPYIYYVGSDTQCSCGFEFHSELFNDPERQDSKESPQALLDLINRLTLTDNVEYYCCWDGDWDEPVEYTRKLNSSPVKLDENYFELVERELIIFEKSALS